MFRGVVARSVVAPLTLGMTTAKWMQLDVESVNICDLWATQPGVYLEFLIQPPETSYSTDHIPHVVEWNGRFYLEDGHHRAMSAVLAGQETIEARVLSIDSLWTPQW